jgi:uncharacterized protein
MDLMVDKLFSDLLSESKKYSDTLPPIHQWHPELSGDIDILIDREGRWFHDSVEIKRASIITLFSKLLKLEGSDYFLVTPNEKWRIQVDVAPLFVVLASLEIRQGHQVIVCQTLTGERILIGRDNPLQMKQDVANKQTYPLLLVRDNISALISRSTFYQLVDWSIGRTHQDGQKEQLIESMGCEFSLGLYSD